MVVQKALNNLKEHGSKDDKVAVASGIAVSVVLVLLAAWAIYFFHKIQKGSQDLNLSGAADQFNFDTVTQAQKDLQVQLGTNQDELTQIREQSLQGGADTQMQAQQMQIQGQEGGGGAGQFGSPGY